MYVLEFEKPIIALKNKIEELKKLQDKENISLAEEIKKLEHKTKQIETKTYSKLSAWEKTQLARHPQRPYTLDFVKQCTTGFIELHGDRAFRDDPSIVGGFCKIEDQSFLVVGHQKGRGTSENLMRNFGMPHPEGYRKSIRLMKLADKFGIPILALIDTVGAYPGIGAEERGQSEAIAYCLKEMAGLRVPVISVVIGEGGSGGALAIGVANKVLMFEHSIYSVISPEGCASILWGDGTRGKDAALSLKYVPEALLKLKIIDEIIPEPFGAAHRNHEEAMNSVKKSVLTQLEQLKPLSGSELVEQRYQRFRKIGEFSIIK